MDYKQRVFNPHCLKGSWSQVSVWPAWSQVNDRFQFVKAPVQKGQEAFSGFFCRTLTLLLRAPCDALLGLMPLAGDCAFLGTQVQVTGEGSSRGLRAAERLAEDSG